MSSFYGYVLMWLFERRLRKIVGRNQFHYSGRDYEIYGDPR